MPDEVQGHLSQSLHSLSTEQQTGVHGGLALHGTHEGVNQNWRFLCDTRLLLLSLLPTSIRDSHTDNIS